MKYIPLNVKTEYDLMNSLIRIDEIISYAKENSIPYIGITDTNMFSAYEFISNYNPEVWVRCPRCGNLYRVIPPNHKSP